MATTDTARDIIARVIHDELAGTESNHGYGCDHTVGRQPQCGRAADEAVAKLPTPPDGAQPDGHMIVHVAACVPCNGARGVNLLDPDDTWTRDDDDGDLDRGTGPDRYPPLIRDADGRVTDVG